MLLVFADSGFGRAHQIEHLPLGIAHLRQDGFGGDASIHQPDPPRLAVQTFDLTQESPQGGLIRGVAIHHFVGQREAFRRYHQGHHNLLAVRPPIPAVAAPGLRILFRFALKIGAGQIVQQHVELRIEQILPALLQMHEQLLLVLQYPIQAAI